jgi:hypothetical protein
MTNPYILEALAAAHRDDLLRRARLTTTRVVRPSRRGDGAATWFRVALRLRPARSPLAHLSAAPCGEVQCAGVSR